MLRHRLVNACVHWQQRLFHAPIELLGVMADRVDLRRHRGRLPSARVVKIEHALDRAGLQAVNKRASICVERAIGWARAIEPHCLIF